MILLVAVGASLVIPSVDAAQVPPPVEMLVYSFSDSNASGFAPISVQVVPGQAVRFILSGTKAPVTITVYDKTRRTYTQTSQLNNANQTTEFTFNLAGEYELSIPLRFGFATASVIATYSLAVPFAYGPYATPVPTATPTATPGPAPAPVSEFSVLYEFGQAKVTFRSPEGQNLTYSYATCNRSYATCNRLDTNAFYSARAAIEQNTTKTLTFSSLPLGYTCFWVSMRSGNSASSWYPVSEAGSQENCVYR